MSPDNVRERKEKRRFTLVFVPGDRSDATRTFSLSRSGIIVATAGSFFVIAALIFGLIAYTPARRLLPGYREELERQTLEQLAEIQRQMNLLAEQITVLRAYNLQLRKALGEELTIHDSLLVVTRQAQAANASLDEAGSPSAGAEAPSLRFGGPEFQVGVQPRTPAERGKLLTLPLSVPAEGYLSRGFDPDRYHFGIDIAGRPGTPILAAADGAVVFSGWTHEDGYEMIIAHDDGTMTVYKHNQALLKPVGAAVKRGEMIALLGNTGERTSGPHLHFEVWKNSHARDPQQYLLVTS